MRSFNFGISSSLLLEKKISKLRSWHSLYTQISKYTGTFVALFLDFKRRETSLDEIRRAFKNYFSRLLNKFWHDMSILFSRIKLDWKFSKNENFMRCGQKMDYKFWMRWLRIYQRHKREFINLRGVEKVEWAIREMTLGIYYLRNFCQVYIKFSWLITRSIQK